MNPQKKLIQIELATQLMMAEITGFRASGNQGFLDYIALYETCLGTSRSLVDIMEQEVLDNQEVSNEEK